MNDINPHFRSVLPALLEDLANASLGIEVHLESAKTAVGSVIDYLDYEIEKVDLQIEKMRFGSRAPPDELAAARARSAGLKEARQAFNADAVMNSMTMINRVVEFLQNLDEDLKENGSPQID